MSEIAARWVTVFPKIADGFGHTINTAVAKSLKDGKLIVSPDLDPATPKKIGSKFQSMLGPILTLSAVAGITSFVKSSVDQFAKLEDSTAAAAVVFGDSMKKITAQSDGAATSMGLSKQAVIDAAATFGTYGKSAGLAGDDLAKFATEMTQMAGDLSSFKGTSPETAIEAIGSALRGEAEPARQFGILLDDLTLRSRAMKMGLIDTTKDALSPQNKVLAAQAEILAQTTDAQGDFARTSQSTANVQKTLAAESANLSAEIGQKLAPAIVEAQKAGIGFLQFVSDNQAAIIPMVATIGTLTLAVGGFIAVSKGLDAVKSARDTIKGLGDSFQAMGTKAKVATISAGAIGIALVAAGAIYGAFAQKQAEVTAAVEDYTSALQADNGELGANTRLQIANRLEKDGVLAAAQKLAIGTDTLVDAILGEGAATANVTAITQAYIDSAQDRTGATDEQLRTSAKVREVLGDETTALGKAVAGYTRVASVTKESTSATTGNTGATNTNSGALQENAEKLNKVYAGHLKLRGDKRSLEAAIDGATESIKKNGKTLDDNTPKGRANAQALDDIASAGLAVGGNMDHSRAAFIKAATAMGKSKEAAEKLADKLGLIKGKTVKVDVEWGKKPGPLVIQSTKTHMKIDYANGGAIRGEGTGTSDSIPAMLSNGEHVLTTSDVAKMGGHQGVYRMRSLAQRGLMHFASGGPVLPSHKGHTLDWWQDKVISELEMVQLQIRVKEVAASLTEKETYNPPGKRKKGKRLVLRDLERTAATLDLAELKEELSIAREAASLNASTSGTVSDRIAAAEAAKVAADTATDDAKTAADTADATAKAKADVWQSKSDSAAAMWQQAASGLNKGTGALGNTWKRNTNAAGQVWFTEEKATVATLASRKKAEAQAAIAFLGKLNQMRQLGVPEAMLNDIMSLGAVEGTRIVDGYLQDRESLAGTVAAYGDIASVQAGYLAIGQQAGADAANGTTPTYNIYEAVDAQSTAKEVARLQAAGRV